MILSNKQTRYLRGLCHGLKPVVMVGQNGLTDSVMHELEQALDHHELVKVKLRGDRDSRQQWIERITEASSAVLVQRIGQVACFFRRNPEQSHIELPR
ncbi:MAG: ribosome assembly RNA-binding protein YhbY [Xanthomonadales bacterium]|nr:ribosome assembly RNA-binding protein YhbY [Xanthomonadales bacterium]